MNNLDKKICFITSSRADYGLIKNLLIETSNIKNYKLQLIATGSHLSKDFGETVKEIKNDGFSIDFEISLDLRKDSNFATCNAISKLISDISKAFELLEPDLIIILGDRYEILGAAIAATIYRIPIAHLHGGEITEGAFDDGIRHAITKLSNLHFVANEIYKNRVIQMGEYPNYVFNVGGLGVDAIKKIIPLSKKQLENDLKIKFLKRNLIITYHPVTLSTQKESEDNIKNLISSLSKLKETMQIFTMPNADPGNKSISNIINEYVNKNKYTYAFKSLGQLRYFSLMSYVDAVVGNSSSGILEAPSFQIGTVNIGDRQKGRLQTSSIINTENNSISISNAISKIYNKEFQKKLKNTFSPYGEGGAALKIINILQQINFKELNKKTFFNIDFSYKH